MIIAAGKTDRKKKRQTEIIRRNLCVRNVNQELTCTMPATSLLVSKARPLKRPIHYRRSGARAAWYCGAEIGVHTLFH